MDLKVRKLNKDAKIPSYKFDGDSGFDLSALYDDYLFPGEQKLIKTGLAFDIPYGFEMQLRPRSGLALKHGITLTNTPATIDSTYTGEVGVVLKNSGSNPFTVNKGDRIAQGVIAPVAYVDLVEVGEIKTTERASGGYGHTGV